MNLLLVLGLMLLIMCLATISVFQGFKQACVLWCFLVATIALPVFVDRLILRRPSDMFEPVYLSSLVYFVSFA